MATSSDDRFRRKLAAFLADPIGAPFLSTRTDAEEEVRKRYNLGSFASDRFDAAGQMASGLGEIVGASPDKPFPSPEETAGESVQIRHPFSGAKIEVPRPDPSALRMAIDNALDRIGDLSDDPQVAYQSLWRNLRPALRAASPQAIQPVWDLAPTSFAGPSSPLFLHRSIRSALSSTQREGHGIASDASLVLFSIGPVQTFIQQARKTKDLYHGSALLSHLAWTAIRPVAEEHGPDAFVFPNLHAQPLADGWLESEGHSVLRSRSDQQRLPTLPNRFFAIVDTGDPAAIRALMRRSQEAVADEWERIGRGVFETSALASVDVPPALTDHLSDALSTYWAAVALQPGSEPVTANGTLRRLTGRIQDEQLAPLRRAVEAASDAPAAARIGLLYPLLYTLLEKQLGSTKTLRPFRQLRGGEGERGRKCSLCGERNALVYRGSPALIRHNEQAAEAPGADPVHLPEGEGLCGACLVKRFADRTGGVSLTTAFDSTADVALSAVRNRYPQAVRTCASKMKGVVPGSRFGAQLLFRENLRAGYLDAEVYPDLDRPTAELEEEADRLREAFDTYLAGPPEALQSSYYAAIALDGDSIGDWLAGANLPSLSSLLESADGTGEALANALSRRPLTASLHGLLSESLSGYALDAVRPIVDNYNGFLVYAGGDDVLCFVGIQHVLDVLVHLRAAFSGHRSGDGTVDFTADPVGFVDEERVRTTLGPTATASAGVAIAHYKTPLRLVLDTAHRMEREHAKQHPGKDACAIALLKRSGDHAEATVPFRSAGIDHPHGLLGVIRDLVQELKATGVSARFFRAFRESIDPLTRSVGTASESEGIETPVLSRLVETEFRRLVRRRPDATDAQADRIAADLRRVFEAVGSDLKAFYAVIDTVLFLFKETTPADAPVDSAA